MVGAAYYPARLALTEASMGASPSYRAIREISPTLSLQAEGGWFRPYPRCVSSVSDSTESGSWHFPSRPPGKWSNERWRLFDGDVRRLEEEQQKRWQRQHGLRRGQGGEFRRIRLIED